MNLFLHLQITHLHGKNFIIKTVQFVNLHSKIMLANNHWNINCLSIQVYQINEWFIINMLLETYTWFIWYLRITTWSPIRMSFYKNDLQMKIKVSIKRILALGPELNDLWSMFWPPNFGCVWPTCVCMYGDSTCILTCTASFCQWYMVTDISHTSYLHTTPSAGKVFIQIQSHWLWTTESGLAVRERIAATNIKKKWEVSSSILWVDLSTWL